MKLLNQLYIVNHYKDPGSGKKVTNISIYFMESKGRFFFLAFAWFIQCRGYLHIGHAKSIMVNFGLANKHLEFRRSFE